MLRSDEESKEEKIQIKCNWILMIILIEFVLIHSIPDRLCITAGKICVG